MNETEFELGNVVITSTGQAGTYMDDCSQGAMVFLANGDIWYGTHKMMRLPQDAADLAAAPYDVDRFKHREAPKGQTKTKAKAQNQKWTKEFDDEDEDY